MADKDLKKRPLKFANFDELTAEINSLHEKGYVSNGNWSLGQCCGHLADWMRFPIDGFPVPPLPIRMMLWVMKVTAGPRMKRKILAEGFKGGMPTAPETVPSRDGLSDDQGIEKFQSTIDRVRSFEGELKPSPLFGPLDKEMHMKVTLLHAEHHLGYLEPKSS